MKIHATVTPWSSIVGTSVTLHDAETGQGIAMMSLLFVSRLSAKSELLKRNSLEIAMAVRDAVEGLDIDVQSEPRHDHD